MTRNRGNRAVFAVALTAAALATAIASPAQAQSPAGKLGNQFT
jgi:hypothetical protein